MLPEITIDDFVGDVKISSNDFNTDEFTKYVEKYREFYTQRYLGVNAYVNIKNNDRQKWTDLMLGGEYEIEEDEWGVHAGFKTMLVYFIYYHYVRDGFQMTEVGAVDNFNENSTRSNQYVIAENRWNMVNSFIGGIIDFICNFTDYTVEITGFTDNITETLILVDDTTYLENGDKVSINDVEYKISNLIPDVSFEIDATGIDFSGESVIYNPYSAVDMDKLRSYTIIGI